MSFTYFIHFIVYHSGLPPDFRCVFILTGKKYSDLCTIKDLLNGSYYATKYFAMSTEFELLTFTYVSDELIFILKENQL